MALVLQKGLVIAGGGSGGGAVDSVNGKTGQVVLTGEDISADVSELTDTVQGHLQSLHNNIKDIELFKFPFATIVGKPVIDHGQVSGFTENDYLQFPWIVDLQDKSFQIDFCFTTGDDISGQQNILDSKFGLALAIKDGKGLMAISHNGTSWAGSVSGTMNIAPNTTYYARLSWNRINYQTQLSTDGETYTPDMNFGSTQSPFATTMFIGGCSGTAIGHEPHPFKGTINLNYAYLTVEGNVIWQGMDDAGLATRMDIDASNITETGKERIKSFVGGLPDQTGQSGKFLTTSGTDASWSDKPLINKATGFDSLAIGSGYTGATGSQSVAIGPSVSANGYYGIGIGNYVSAGPGIAIGRNISIGNNGYGSIVIGKGSTLYTNNDRYTFKIVTENGIFEMMSADGTIPADRLAKNETLTTDAITLVPERIYTGGELATVSVTLPTALSTNEAIQLNFGSGATATNITINKDASQTLVMKGAGCSGGVFSPAANKNYSIMFYNNGFAIIGLVIEQ